MQHRLPSSCRDLVDLQCGVISRQQALLGGMDPDVRLDNARHPSLLPPRTRIEETVLDLVQQAADFDAAFDWACRAGQRRLTKADLLASAMTRRNRLRWRAELAAALADIGEGVHSLLEYRYVRDVERRHGLPAADRQARARRGYLDNLYEEYQVCVELDGRAAHPDDRRWQDIHRDNAAAAEGQVTLRYNRADIAQRACLAASEVGTTLLQRGWPGPIRRCPRCPPCR
jgi:very-short-patch-repair endonuclease